MVVGSLEAGGGKVDGGRGRLEAIHDEVRRRICTLLYEPGKALREVDLAKEFNVSRTPIRQVLQRLEFEGLVQSRRGVGTIVTRVDLAAVRDIFAMREKLAELIGSLDPIPPTHVEIRAMEELKTRVAALRAQPDPTEFATLNLEFNESIMSMVGNKALRDASMLLFYQGSRIWLSWIPAFDWDHEIDTFAREVEELLIAMRLRDMTAVGYTHRNHISMSLIRIRQYLDPPRR